MTLHRLLVVSSAVAYVLAGVGCSSTDSGGQGPTNFYGGAPGTFTASGGGSSGTGGFGLGGAQSLGGTDSGGSVSLPASGGSGGTGTMPPVTGGATSSATGGRSDADASLGGTPSAGGKTGSGGNAAGGSGGTSAGTGGTTGNDAGDIDPCAGGATEPASDDASSRTPVQGYGTVELEISTKTQILSLETTLAVPEKPPANGTLFLWPGLQPLPGGANYYPIGNGVLQPVLTWGGTCAPTAPNDYEDWWISAQYVNTYGNAAGYTGCLGGQGMTVQVGDRLHILMTLKDTTWSQAVLDEQSGDRATFDIDMKGQAQDWAIFSIEADGREPVSDVIFTSTVLTLAAASPGDCNPSARGQNDYFSAPRVSPDGTSCCISKIVLRGQGVAATTQN